MSGVNDDNDESYYCEPIIDDPGIDEEEEPVSVPDHEEKEQSGEVSSLTGDDDGQWMTSPSASTVKEEEDVFSHTSSGSNKCAPPKKFPNQLIQAQFTITGTKDGCFKVVCNHCKEACNWGMFNTSNATKHIVEWCKEAPEIIKLECNSSMQISKRHKKDNGVVTVGPTGTVSEESTVMIVGAKTAKTKRSAKQQKIVSYGPLLNEETTNNAIMKAVKTILSQFKPLNQLRDEFFLDELV